MNFEGHPLSIFPNALNIIPFPTSQNHLLKCSSKFLLNVLLSVPSPVLVSHHSDLAPVTAYVNVAEDASDTRRMLVGEDQL